MNTFIIAYLTSFCVDVDDSLTWIIAPRKHVYSTTAFMYSNWCVHILYNLEAFYSIGKINKNIIRGKFTIWKKRLHFHRTFIWANEGGWFPLCHVKSSMFGLTLLWLRQTDIKSEVLWTYSCSLNSITFTPHIWTCTSLGWQFSLGFFVLLYPGQQQKF